MTLINHRIIPIHHKGKSVTRGQKPDNKIIGNIVTNSKGTHPILLSLGGTVSVPVVSFFKTLGATVFSVGKYNTRVLFSITMHTLG